MIDTNLAVRLIPDYNKQVPQTLIAQAAQSYSITSSVIAAENIKAVAYPSRQPLGSGNELIHNKLDNFYRRSEPIPDDSKPIILGDIDDYQEDFTSYLNEAEVIDSYVISSTAGLDILTDENASPVIKYRLEGVDSTSALQAITIVVTTDGGRVNTRIINFELK